MKKSPQLKNPLDEAEMRAFYASCGISKSTTEAAIEVRRGKPVSHDNNESSLDGKPRRKRRQAAARDI